jgi:hypothetical protein
MFWQVFDPDIVPGLKPRLVTHAYQTFFDRTIANFEALVEGRDIRIGRAVDEPAAPPVEYLMPLLQQIGEVAMPFLRQLAGGNDGAMVGADHRIDSDGFVHITPAQSTAPDPERWVAEITRFFDGLGQAVRRDLTLARPAA